MTPERRYFEGAVENKSDEGQIFGYGAVFNSTSQRLFDPYIGEFTEEIASEAFKRSLEDPSLLILSNHDQNFILGRIGAGTATAGVDETGAWYRAKPPSTRKDVLESVQRGDMVGSSFAFDIGEEEWEERSGIPHRTIRSFKKIYDMGPVSYPAYLDTTATARSYKQFEKAINERSREDAAGSLSRCKMKLWFYKNSITI